MAQFKGSMDDFCRLAGQLVESEVNHEVEHVLKKIRNDIRWGAFVLSGFTVALVIIKVLNKETDFAGPLFMAGLWGLYWFLPLWQRVRRKDIEVRVEWVSVDEDGENIGFLVKSRYRTPEEKAEES